MSSQKDWGKEETKQRKKAPYCLKALYLLNIISFCPSIILLLVVSLNASQKSLTSTTITDAIALYTLISFLKNRHENDEKTSRVQVLLEKRYKFINVVSQRGKNFYLIVNKYKRDSEMEEK